MTKKSKISGAILAICLCLCVHTFAPLPAQASNNTQKKTLFINQTVKVALPEGTNKNKVKWSSSNKKVVRITQTGKMTGIKKGTATIKAINKANKKVLAVYKVNVKKFQEKQIAAKIKLINNSSKGYLNLLNKKYYIVTSKNELIKLQKDFCKKYVEAGLGTEAQCKNTEFYKKLSSYKKSFFTHKTLCITEHMLYSSGQPTKAGKFTRKQNAKGNVYGQLEVIYEKLPENVHLITQISYQEYFIELNKNDATVLQNYKISVTQEK